MSTFSVKAYGAEVRVVVKEGLNCCGIRQLEQFHVPSYKKELTDEQVNKILKQLYRKVRVAYKHVLVAGDAIGEGWQGAGGNTSRVGSLSLSNFCKVNEFSCVPNSINPNNGNTINVYVSTYMTKDSAGRVQEGTVPPEQDFSDDDTSVAISKDAQKIAEAIFNFLES